MTANPFPDARHPYDRNIQALMMDQHWQEMADAARHAGHPVSMDTSEDLMLKLQRQQYLMQNIQDNLTDHFPVQQPYPPSTHPYYHRSTIPGLSTAGYLPLSPPHSCVPSLGSSGCGTNSRHTSPTVSETSSSRTNSWPNSGLTQPSIGPDNWTQHIQPTNYIQGSFGYYSTTHEQVPAVIAHNVINMNQVQLSQDEATSSHGKMYVFDNAAIGTATRGVPQRPQHDSSDDGDGSTVDTDSTEMNIDQELSSDNDDNMSEAASEKDAEGEDDDDQDYDPSADNRKKIKLSPRQRSHRRTTSSSSKESHGPGPIRTTKSKGKGKKRVPPPEVRAFPCPFVIYGCQESFGSKNEWKRHINTQHLSIIIYRCKYCCPPNRARQVPYKQQKYDFVRKDLFTMHLKRMHVTECNIEVPVVVSGSDNKKLKDPPRTIAILNEVSKGCETQVRSPPETVECILCESTFNGPKCWEERTEHIATAHFEVARKAKTAAPSPDEWNSDESLEAWLARENIIKQARDGTWRLA